MSKVKLMLINSPTQSYLARGRIEKYETIPPLGLGYLLSYVKHHEKLDELYFLDSEQEGLSIKQIAEKAKLFSPNLIGLNIFSPNYILVSELCAELKKVNNDFIIFLGGALARIEKEKLITKGWLHKNVSFVCYGEGEQTISDALDFYEDGKIDLSQVNGIAYVDEFDCVRVNPATKNVSNIDSILDHSFFTNDMVCTGNKKESFMLTSRGCPYKCNFCAAPVMYSGKFKIRSMVSINRELVELIKNGCNYIRFVDDLFIASSNRVKGIYEIFTNNKIDSSWFGFEANGRANIMANFTSEIWDVLKNMGLIELELGIESGSQKILDFMNKGITLEQVRKVVRESSKRGIKIKGFIMVGYLTETVEDMNKTLGFMKALKEISNNTIRFSPVPVKAYKGSNLYSQTMQIAKIRGIDLENNVNIDLSAFACNEATKRFLKTRTRYNSMHSFNGNAISLSEISNSAKTSDVLEFLTKMCIVNLD